MRNDQIFVVEGKCYIFHDTLLAIYGEPVDETGNPVDDEWIILPKNWICWLLIERSEFFARHWFHICVIGVLFGATGLIIFGSALVKAVMMETPFGGFWYFGLLTLVCLIDFVAYGGSLLYEIRSPRQRAEEEELEE